MRYNVFTESFIGVAAGTSPMCNHACGKVRNMKINGELNDKAVFQELANRFKQYRIAYPMTRTELADKAMVSVGTVARFENNNDISLCNVIKLIKAIGLIENLDLLIPDYQNRPSFYVGNENTRKRAGRKKKDQISWKWGDEQ